MIIMALQQISLDVRQENYDQFPLIVGGLENMSDSHLPLDHERDGFIIHVHPALASSVEIVPVEF